MRIPNLASYMWWALKLLYGLCRNGFAAAKNCLRTWGEDLAKNAPTASVIRGSRIPLRGYLWPLARALEREGHGAIRDGCYETWVNVTPAGVLMADQMRRAFSPRRYDWAG